eukprot:403377018
MKKCGVKGMNKSLLDPSKENLSILCNDNSQFMSRQPRIKDSHSTQRSQGGTSRSKTSQMGINLRIKNVLQSAKNQRREPSKPILIEEHEISTQMHPNYQHSRQMSARSQSQGVQIGEKQKKTKQKSHRRQKSGAANMSQLVISQNVNEKRRKQLNFDQIENRIQQSNIETRIKQKKINNFQEQELTQEDYLLNNQKQNFYEKEYQEIQKQLIKAQQDLLKGHYKIQAYEHKCSSMKAEIQDLQIRIEQEQENSMKLYQRGKKYKRICIEKEKELQAIKNEFKNIIDTRNDEITNIKESIDQQMQVFFTQKQSITNICKEINTKSYKLQSIFQQNRDLAINLQANQLLNDILRLTDKVFNRNSIQGDTIKTKCDSFNQNETVNQVQNDQILEHATRQAKDIEQQQQVINDLKRNIEQIENENTNLKEERMLYVQQLQKFENSQRSQEKLYQFMNQSQVNQQSSSFHSNNNIFQSNQDPKQGTSQMMAPFMLSETGRHFQNIHNIKNQTDQYKNFQKQNYQDNNFIQSDPGMIRFIDENIDHNYAMQNHLKMTEFQNEKVEQVQSQNKVPPLLILKDISNMINQNSGPVSSIRTGLTSTTNQQFKNKFQIMSPASTLSMQHIQLPTYKSPISNTASSFTLNNNIQSTNNTQNFNDYGINTANLGGSQLNQNQIYQYGVNQAIIEVKHSGRSHETSTFQQHQDFLESLKVVGEESEEDHTSSYAQNQSNFIAKNYMRYPTQIENRDLFNNDQSMSCYDADHSYVQENRIKSSQNTSPQNYQKSSNFSSNQVSQHQFDSLPSDPEIGRHQQNQKQLQNKDTITASSQILSDRTFNLKKEINCLDEEILMLQSSLQNQLAKRKT